MPGILISQPDPDAARRSRRPGARRRARALAALLALLALLPTLAPPAAARVYVTSRPPRESLQGDPDDGEHYAPPPPDLATVASAPSGGLKPTAGEPALHTCAAPRPVVIVLLNLRWPAGPVAPGTCVLLGAPWLLDR